MPPLPHWVPITVMLCPIAKLHCGLPATDGPPLTFSVVSKRYFTLRSCFFQKVVPLELDFSLVLPLKLVQQLALKSNF